MPTTTLNFTSLARPSLPLRQLHPQRGCRSRSRVFITRAKEDGTENTTPSSSSSENENVAAQFARFVAAAEADLNPPSSPSPLLSPTNVCRALCSSLQRPDYPEPGSGLRTAFDFTLPGDVGPGAPLFSPPRRARSWNAGERFLTFDDFAKDSLLLHSSNRSSAPAGSLLVNCDSWEIEGDLIFTGRGSVSGIGDASKAAQAVSLEVAKDGGGGNGDGGKSSNNSSSKKKKTVTILLSRVDDAGPWKGCWLIYGVRNGNYSL